MISVFICEDDCNQRQYLEKIIENYIMIEEFDMSIVVATAEPKDVVSYLKSNVEVTGLYFLDINLNNDINGIQLAADIRKYDTLGNIVFVTTHSELVLTTFKYKVAALDYILKDTPEEIQHRLYACMRIADKRHSDLNTDDKKNIKIKVGHQIKSLEISKITYIETARAPHKLIIHMFNREIEFYSTIKEIVQILNKSVNSFLQVHQSVIVNLNNIDSVDKKKREIRLCNGDVCFASYKGLKRLQEMQGKNNK